MNIAKMLGMRPKDKHVSQFMSMAMSLATELDGKQAARTVADMSDMYIWIEEKADDGVKGFLGQFMSTTFSNLLIETRNAGLAGKLAHTFLVAFLEMTHTRGKSRNTAYSNIEWLHQHEKALQGLPKEKPVTVVTDEMIAAYAKDPPGRTRTSQQELNDKS